MPNHNFEELLQEIEDWSTRITTFQDTFEDLNSEKLTAEQVEAELRRRGMIPSSGGTTVEGTASGLTITTVDGRPQSLWEFIADAIKISQGVREDKVRTILALFPDRTLAEPVLRPLLTEQLGFPSPAEQAMPPTTVPVQIGLDADGQAVIANVSPDTAARLQQANFQFSNLSAAEQARLQQELLIYNNLSARDVADLTLANRTAGRLDSDLVFRIGEAQRRFDLDARLADANLIFRQLEVAGQFAGLELTSRSQRVQALGQDMATQILLGRMAVEQAALKLKSVALALDAERQEREVQLRFAVKRSSIRIDPATGEQVTLLPFGATIARILGLPIEDFELPVGEVNPAAKGQAVLDATAFESPIPGLQEASAKTKAAIDAILGEPVPGLDGPAAA